MRQCPQRPLVQRHRMPLQTLKVVRGKADVRWPQHALAIILGKPQIEATDDVGLHLPSMFGAVGDRHTDVGRCQPRQLVLHRPHIAAMAGEPNAFDEGSQTLLDLDLRRAGAKRLTVQMGKDQSRLWAVGEANLDPASFRRVLHSASFNQQRYPALLTLPEPYRVARVSVWQAGLAEDGMLE